LVMAENDVRSGEGVKPTLRQSSFTLTTTHARFCAVFGASSAPIVQSNSGRLLAGTSRRGSKRRCHRPAHSGDMSEGTHPPAASTAAKLCGPTDCSSGHTSIGSEVASIRPEGSRVTRNSADGSRVSSNRWVGSSHWMAADTPLETGESHIPLSWVAPGHSSAKAPVNALPSGDQ
jgi:hypothetical protein